MCMQLMRALELGVTEGTKVRALPPPFVTTSSAVSVSLGRGADPLLGPGVTVEDSSAASPDFADVELGLWTARCAVHMVSISTA